MRIAGFFCLMVCVLCQTSFAGDYHHPGPYQGSAAFEQLKGLAGRWEGTTQMGEEVKKAVVEYRVISNGSVVVEKLMPGSPDEMISVYHDEGGKISMTHYCGLHNRPVLKTTSIDRHTMQFDFTHSEGIDPSKDAHMHSLKISLGGGKTMKHEWVLYQDGQAFMTTVMDFKKVS